MEDPIRFAASGWVDHAYVGFTGASVCSSSVGNAFAEIIATTGVLYGVFYAVSAVTNAWYYRTQLRRGAGDLIIVGVLPLAAAAFLTWIIVKSVATFTRGEDLTVIGIIVSGLVLLAIAHQEKSPFFSIDRTSPRVDGYPLSDEGGAAI